MFFICVPSYSPYQRQLTYNIMLYESWLHSVFHIYSTYTTLKPWSSEVCSAYALQTSLTSILRLCIYTQNTPRNHDSYITVTYHLNRAFSVETVTACPPCPLLSLPLPLPPLTLHVDPNGRINVSNWRFLSLILGVVVPRNKVILAYIHAHLKRCSLESHTEEGKFAQYCLQTLQRTLDAKNRKYPPSRQEAICVVNR